MLVVQIIAGTYWNAYQVFDGQRWSEVWINPHKTISISF